jgi:hydroxymethylbilane synthase
VDKPLHAIGGKGLFTRELELALLDGSIDFAVHSLKDVPVTMPLVDQADLQLVAIPRRGDARDLLVSSKASSIDELPHGAVVGTGSLRRRCQLLHRRSDLQVFPLRGNVDTRLRHLASGKFDAVILAQAGVERSGLLDRSLMHPIPTEVMLPAAGQGALALQCSRRSLDTRQMLERLNDANTALCAKAERAIVWALNGDCHSPIAAFAQVIDGRLWLRAAVGHRDTNAMIGAEATGSPLQFPAVVEQVIAELRRLGAEAMLRAPVSESTTELVEAS